LGAEVEGLAGQRLAGGLAAEAELLELVALLAEVEAQLAEDFAARAHQRLVAAEEGGELHRNGRALADGAGFQADAFGAELLAGAGILVADARVVDGQAVNVQLDRHAGAGGLPVGGRGRGLGAGRGVRGGVGAGWLGARRLADAFPVAASLLVVT